MAATLGLCRADDLPDLLRFLDEHWKRGHAFTICGPLLDWQHREADGDTYSFVLARRERDRELIGILGFLPTRRFDPALTADNTVWLTTWKVRDDAADAGLGLRMLRFLTAAERHVAVGAITVNAGTQPIYARLGYRVGELHHYVLPNADVAQFELATIDRVMRRPPNADDDVNAVIAVQMDAEELSENAPSLDRLNGGASAPHKTARYFAGRYLRHPIYRYGVYALLDQAAPCALMATRLAEHEGRRALRIVDYMGSADVLARAGRAIREIIVQQDAEYADVYNTGIDAAVFARAGFALVDPSGASLVPDHFEPFERRNVRLWFSMKSESVPVLFKGDADQDRPNVVPAA